LEPVYPHYFPGSNPLGGHRLQGCLIGGAIGDTLGSFYEGKTDIKFIEFDSVHGITDDTQLTQGTCESIIAAGYVSAEGVVKKWWSGITEGKLLAWGPVQTPPSF